MSKIMSMSIKTDTFICTQHSNCIFRASGDFIFSSEQPAMVTTIKIVSKNILAGGSDTQKKKKTAIGDHRKSLL